MSGVAMRTSWALGWNEARRLVAHPAYLVGAFVIVPTMGLSAVAGASFPSARQVFDFVVNVQLVWYGLVSLLAAGLVASLARRSRAEEVLESQPAGPGTRAAARCLAVLLGPATLSVVLTGGVWLLERSQDQPFGTFTGAELAQVPFVVLGAGLLGVLAARWMRWRGGLLVALVGTVVATGWVLGQGRFGWLAPWTTSRTLLDDDDFADGSQLWHAAYLALLCGLAFVAVCLSDAVRKVPLVALSAVVAGLAAFVGWAQLP
ncbi:MAG: hypothetical protein H0U35_01485 [Sporichthyaceae bacterium]|nr:hypothetical protein [Sporichthyaceae bacterium]